MSAGRSRQVKGPSLVALCVAHRFREPLFHHDPGCFLCRRVARLRTLAYLRQKRHAT